MGNSLHFKSFQVPAGFALLRYKTQVYEGEGLVFGHLLRSNFIFHYFILQEAQTKTPYLQAPLCTVYVCKMSLSAQYFLFFHEP